MGVFHTWRLGRDRKSFLPLLEINRVSEGDLAKEVLLGARNPRFRDEATLFECFRLVVKEVDDIVGDFWWETWIRHCGSGQEADHPFGAGLSFDWQP